MTLIKSRGLIKVLILPESTNVTHNAVTVTHNAVTVTHN